MFSKIVNLRLFDKMQGFFKYFFFGGGDIKDQVEIVQGPLWALRPYVVPVLFIKKLCFAGLAVSHDCK